MSSNLKQALFVALGSIAPCICWAQQWPHHNSDATALDNCARAAADHLNAKLIGENAPDVRVPDWQVEYGAPQKQMLVTIRNPQSRIVAQMVCTYDWNDQVVALRPATPSERYDYGWDVGH
jgi:hypothetical protein